MFQSILAFIGFNATSNIGMKVWAVTTLTLMVSVLWAAGQSCAQYVCGPAIQAISTSHPSFAVGLSLGFNPTTYGLASCYMSVYTACQLYIYKKRTLDKLV